MKRPEAFSLAPGLAPMPSLILETSSTKIGTTTEPVPAPRIKRPIIVVIVRCLFADSLQLFAIESQTSLYGSVSSLKTALQSSLIN